MINQSNNNQTISLEELTAMAQAKGHVSPQDEKKRGLEFMGTRFNIINKRKELKRTKAVTPAEYFLLEEIELQTIGGQNSKSTICSKAELYIEDLSRELGYKAPDKIWRLLKSLRNKNLILREPTRSKGKELIGLNPAAFGQILIDSQHAVETKRHLKIVVDNTKNGVDKSTFKHTNRPWITYEVYVDHRRTICRAQTKRRLTHRQLIEIKKEKSPLESSRVYIESSRGSETGTGKSCTPIFGTGSGTPPRRRQFADPCKERDRQFREYEEAMQAGII